MYFSRLGVKGLNVSRTKNLAPRDFWRQKALGTMLRTLTSAIPQTGSARWFSTWFCRPAHSWSAVSFSLDSSRPERVCWLALCCAAGCVASLHPSPQVSPFWRLASPWWNSSSCDWEIPCEINSRVSAFVAGVLGENVWGWVSTWWRWGWDVGQSHYPTPTITTGTFVFREKPHDVRLTRSVVFCELEGVERARCQSRSQCLSQSWGEGPGIEVDTRCDNILTHPLGPLLAALSSLSVPGVSSFSLGASSRSAGPDMEPSELESRRKLMVNGNNSIRRNRHGCRCKKVLVFVWDPFFCT